MTVSPVPGRAHDAVSPGEVHNRVARWAVGLGVAALTFLATGFVLGLAHAVWGDYPGMEEEGTAFGLMWWLAALSAVAALPMAIVARLAHQRWRMLWLPLLMLPTIMAVAVLGNLVG